MDDLINIPSITIEDRSEQYWRPNSTHLVVKCENGYGASIIKTDASYGGDRGFYEIAVFHGKEELCYATPITDDVIGWCTPQMLGEILAKIAALPVNKYCTHGRIPTFERSDN
jgi:hypothetical protein